MPISPIGCASCCIPDMAIQTGNAIFSPSMVVSSLIFETSAIILGLSRNLQRVTKCHEDSQLWLSNFKLLLHCYASHLTCYALGSGGLWSTGQEQRKLTRWKVKNGSNNTIKGRGSSLLKKYKNQTPRQQHQIVKILYSLMSGSHQCYSNRGNLLLAENNYWKIGKLNLFVRILGSAVKL